MSSACMCISAILRTIFFIKKYGATGITKFQFVLPVLSCILMCIALLFFRDKPCLTILPVALGCIFFAVKALSFKPIHMVLCCILYGLVLLLFTLTITDKIHNSIFLILVFALPLAFHILQDAYEILYKFADDTMLWGEVKYLGVLPELSVIFIMASLLFLSIGIDRVK